MPSKRSGIGAASINRSIYVLGGERRQGTFDNNERYDRATNTWTIETPMLTARRGLGVAPIGDKIYVIGRGPNPRLSVPWENEIYNVNRMD